MVDQLARALDALSLTASLAREERQAHLGVKARADDLGAQLECWQLAFDADIDSIPREVATQVRRDDLIWQRATGCDTPGEAQLQSLLQLRISALENQAAAWHQTVLHRVGALLLDQRIREGTHYVEAQIEDRWWQYGLPDPKAWLVQCRVWRAIGVDAPLAWSEWKADSWSLAVLGAPGRIVFKEAAAVTPLSRGGLA